MIAPDFRATEQIEILGPSKKFISYNYGRDIFYTNIS